MNDWLYEEADRLSSERIEAAEARLARARAEHDAAQDELDAARRWRLETLLRIRHERPRPEA